MKTCKKVKCFFIYSARIHLYLCIIALKARPSFHEVVKLRTTTCGYLEKELKHELPIL